MLGGGGLSFEICFGEEVEILNSPLRGNKVWILNSAMGELVVG